MRSTRALNFLFAAALVAVPAIAQTGSGDPNYGSPSSPNQSGVKPGYGTGSDTGTGKPTTVQNGNTTYPGTGSNAATGNGPGFGPGSSSYNGAPGGDRHDFGWIGLFGLAGLAGLMRRDRTRNTETTTRERLNNPAA